MFEGQPRLLTEASTLSVPSIYPSYGGMDEYFPKDYQYSYTQFNEEELINKIKLLDDSELLKKESKRISGHINFLLDQKYMSFKKLLIKMSKKKSEQLVSVIMSVYNTKKNISNSIQSILNQVTKILNY